MDIIWQKPLSQNAGTMLRQAGYIPLFDRLSGKQSFAFQIGPGHYPRFHVYVEEETEARLKLHLHLDSKEHGWGERRHDSVYDSDEVRAEAARVKRWLEHFAGSGQKGGGQTRGQAGEAPAGSKEEGGFWAKFFGNDK
ncbi:MAG: hypothetical protein HY461_02785 [Parcubacteria group bacterium]|nr:hypothetical protein [Parcubacteria group bacterium]